MSCYGIAIGHWAKTIILGLGSNTFDVYSDLGSGIYHLEAKNVTRTFSANETVPESCFPLPDNNNNNNNNNNNTEEQYECLEEDNFWASITFGCIQLPALVLAICAAVAAVFLRCTIPQHSGGYKKILAGALLLLIIPFPLVVFSQQVASLFIQTDQMELLSAIFLFGEGALEASPQLLLLLYIIVSDAERQIPWIQKASIISLLLTISKTAIELYVSESYGMGMTLSRILNHNASLNDSILKDKSLGRKLWIMTQFSPAFILSLVFKVGSIAIICALLKVCSVIYLVIGITVTFFVAYNKCNSANTDQKAGSALFYSLTNTTILAKCPLNDREDNQVQMKAVSEAWLLLHSATLVGLMIWVGILPDSTHLDHWSSHRFALIQPHIFYPTTVGILLLGPLSILALWGLEKQVKALEEKEESGREFWDARL